MSDLLQVADLERAKLHDTFHSEVITGKSGGLAGGSDINSSTNGVTGQVQATLPYILSRVGGIIAFDFATGGTIYVSREFVKDGENNVWQWTGTFPHVVTAGTNPNADIRWTKISALKPIVVEVDNQTDENLAFSLGAIAVVRTDLIGPRSSLFMDFKNPFAFMDKSEFFHPMEKVVNPVIDESSESPFGVGVADFSAGYITTADTLDLRFNSTTGWCIECYLKILAGGHNFIMSKGVLGELNDAWYFALITGGGGYNLTFTSRNNDGIISFAYPYSTDTANFHHISLNVDTTSARVYIDGVLAHTAPSFEFFNTAAELTIGAWNFTSAGVAGTYMDALNVSNDGALRTTDFNPPRG